MDENHAILKIIGVSCEKLNQLVEAAIKAGALGAKLCGSGQGGNMIALLNENEQIDFQCRTCSFKRRCNRNLFHDTESYLILEMILYFLKLGGSLITDKDKAHSARLDSNSSYCR